VLAAVLPLPHDGAFALTADERLAHERAVERNTWTRLPPRSDT
jgi:hypothetical protein